MKVLIGVVVWYPTIYQFYGLLFNPCIVLVSSLDSTILFRGYLPQIRAEKIINELGNERNTKALPMWHQYIYRTLQ